MKKLDVIWIAALCLLTFGTSGCSGGKYSEDRSSADSLFQAVTSLTGEYTVKIAAARDSAEWAAIAKDYEDRLDKVNFSLPADTDLLLTEGQNDTIYQMTEAYIAARDARITTIMHPKASVDSIPDEELVN